MVASYHLILNFWSLLCMKMVRRLLALPPDSHQGLCLCTPLGALSTDCVISSCSVWPAPSNFLDLPLIHFNNCLPGMLLLFEKLHIILLFHLLVIRQIRGLLFTVRCTLMQSAVLLSYIVCLSVCLSVTFRYRDHIGWNSSKIISRLISVGSLLLGAPTSAI